MFWLKFSTLMPGHEHSRAQRAHLVISIFISFQQATAKLVQQLCLLLLTPTQSDLIFVIYLSVLTGFPFSLNFFFYF